MPLFGSYQYPRHAVLWHHDSVVLSGNALANVVDGTQLYLSVSRQNTPANLDSFAQQVVLDAGSYTFSVLGETLSGCGLIDWYIDGVKVVSLQDWYSSGTVANVAKSATVAVAFGGRHILKGAINGKNASSSNYNAFFTKMWFSQVGIG